LLNGLAIEVFQPGPQHQFGRRHYLRLQATEAAGDREHFGGGCALNQVMALDAPRRGLLPGKFQHPNNYPNFFDTKTSIY